MHRLLNLHGREAVVTGGNDGIGLGMARGPANAGGVSTPTAVASAPSVCNARTAASEFSALHAATTLLAVVLQGER